MLCPSLSLLRIINKSRTYKIIDRFSKIEAPQHLILKKIINRFTSFQRKCRIYYYKLNFISMRRSQQHIWKQTKVIQQNAPRVIHRKLPQLGVFIPGCHWKISSISFPYGLKKRCQVSRVTWTLSDITSYSANSVFFPPAVGSAIMGEVNGPNVYFCMQ